MSEEELAIELSKIINQVFEKAFEKSESSCSTDSCSELTFQDGKIISFINDRNGCIMKELADAFKLPLSTATGLVDRLVEKHFVCRDRSDEDRRIVRLSLTSSGKEIAALTKQKSIIFAKIFLDPLTTVEKRILVELFKKISEDL